MPIQRCRKDGKPGYRWKTSGTCYTGADAISKAVTEGLKIESRKHR